MLKGLSGATVPSRLRTAEPPDRRRWAPTFSELRCLYD
jgi:hypothetical protein